MQYHCEGEKVVGEPGCDENASCRQGNGGLRCYCKDGYAGNGITCEEGAEDLAEGGKTFNSDDEEDNGSATDGDDSTCTTITEQDHPWYAIDLGKVITVSKVKFITPEGK